MSEAIRTIDFTATENSVTPNSPQIAGVQGEHNVTQIRFTLDGKPAELINDPDYKFRFEYIDNLGNCEDTTDFITPDDESKLTCFLPLSWTSSGGNATIRLCVVKLGENNVEEQILYSFAGRLIFIDRENVAFKKYEPGLSGLIESTHAAAENANTAADEAREAAQGADEAAEAAQQAKAAADSAAQGAREAEADAEAAAAEARKAKADADAASADAVQAAEEAREAAGEAGRAADAADEAAADASAVAQTVQSKLDAGEFKGEKGDKGDQGDPGVSGVYVGSGAMPEGYNVQVDPEGELTCYTADEADALFLKKAEATDGWTKGEADDRFANALRGTASGMAVRLDDVSPIGAFSRLAAVGATTETGTGEKGPGNPYTLVGAKPTALTLCGKNLYVDRIEAYSKPMDYWICPVSLVQGCTYTLSASRIGSQIAGCTVAFATGGDDYAEFNTPPNQFIILVAYDGTTWKKTFTVDAAFTAPVLAIFASDRAAFEKLFANYAIQLELGDAATAYEPYADTAEHALPEGLELYGGFGVCDEYDAVTGVKTQRWKRLEFDGTEDWQTAVSEDAGFSLNLSAGEAAKEKAITELYCSHFPPSYGGAIPMEGRCYLLSTGLALLLYPPTDSLLDTVEAFKAWLAAQAEAGTPVTVAYQLAEETEEALAEPARIAPPAPVCQVYADAGTVEVAYNRDVNLAMAGMDKRIAALEEALAALLEG